MELTRVPPPPGFKSESAETNSEEYYLNMGPQHPSTHGVLRLVVKLDGENVIEVIPHLGYIHRAIEKMGENETCVQYIHLTDRMDYLSSHMNNLCVCMAIEKATNIGVPERGEYIRVIVSELQRIQSHLLFWGVFGMDLGAVTAFLYGFKEREKITKLFEELCGARLTMNFFRPGGSYADLPENFLDQVRDVLSEIKVSLDEHDNLITHNVIVQERTKGIGILSKEKAISYGCSGPVARASGLKLDVRITDPYSIYDRFDFDIPIGKTGDCFDRYQVRVREMRESVKIIEQAIKTFPGGPHQAKELVKYKLPKGNYSAQVETARGLFGTYFVGNNSDKPYRVKTRTPNLSNLGIISEISKNHKIADLVANLSTLDLVIPDIDR